MPDALVQMRRGLLAAIFALASGIAMLLLTRVDTIGYAPQKPLYLIAGAILLVSSVGAIIPGLDSVGQILLWNGLGWSIGLTIFGLESVGAMPIWPCILAILGLSFWPRSPERRLPLTAIVIAMAGGVLVCLLGWSEVQIPIPREWLEGL